MLAPIPNFSKYPTICQTSHFSLNSWPISIAFSFEIPLISASLDGSNLKTLIVSSPNLSTILSAVDSLIYRLEDLWADADVKQFVDED